MPGFSYPFVFECFACGERTVVDRTDAAGLHPTPDSHAAVYAVLEKREWVHKEMAERLLCPDCTGRKE